MKAALSRSTGLPLSCLLAAACTDTTLYSSHEPMHPITDYVYLKAEATGSIDRIELWLQRFEVVADDTGKYDEVAETTKYMVWVCDPASYVSSLKCVHRQAFSGHHGEEGIGVQDVVTGLCVLALLGGGAVLL